jgi:hypothetical protein
MFSDDFTFSKRQLGLLLVGAGILGALGILSLDIINAGREGGIGPAQRLGLGIAVGLALIGLALVPLGDDPA